MDLIEDKKPSLVILDNLLTLCSFEDNNRGEQFMDSVAPILLEMRKRSIATILVHHSGKSGSQLGSMTKEILQDIIIKTELEDPGSFITYFNWHFEKGRYIFGSLAKDIRWSYSGGLLKQEEDKKDSQHKNIIQLKKQGLSHREVAKRLGCSKNTVSNVMKDAPVF